MIEDTQQTLELTVRRTLEPPRGAIAIPSGATARAIEIDGFQETLTVTNYSNHPTAFTLLLRVDGDFAGLPELRNGSLNLGQITRAWDAAGRRLTFAWRARHAFRHGREEGSAEDWRAVALDVLTSDGPVEAPAEGLAFGITLPPGGAWKARLRVTPFVQSLGALTPDGHEPPRRHRPLRIPRRSLSNGDRLRRAPSRADGPRGPSTLGPRSGTTRVDDGRRDPSLRRPLRPRYPDGRLAGRDGDARHDARKPAGTRRTAGTIDERLARRNARTASARGAHRSARNPERQSAGALLRVGHDIGVLPAGPRAVLALDR